MKLFIRLHKTTTTIDSIRSALRNTNIEVALEDERIVLATSDLIAFQFDPNANAQIDATWGRVRELLAIVNGAAKAEGVPIELSLASLTYADPGDQRQQFPIIGKMEAFAPSMRSGEPDPAEFIALALKDKAAAKALRLYSIELDWTNLYRIYEIIVEDAKQSTIFARGWASEDEIKTFKASANNASVSGDLARHGTMKHGKPKQTMSMARARHVIRRVLSNWLNSKIK